MSQDRVTYDKKMLNMFNIHTIIAWKLANRWTERINLKTFVFEIRISNIDVKKHKYSYHELYFWGYSIPHYSVLFRKVSFD